MTEHSNVVLARGGYKAFNDGDLDALKELFAVDIVWHNGGRNPLSGDYRGIDEVLSFFGKLFEYTEGTLKIEVDDVLANDNRAVGLITFTANRKAKSLSVPMSISSISKTARLST